MGKGPEQPAQVPIELEIGKILKDRKEVLGFRRNAWTRAKTRFLGTQPSAQTKDTASDMVTASDRMEHSERDVMWFGIMRETLPPQLFLNCLQKLGEVDRGETQPEPDVSDLSPEALTQKGLPYDEFQARWADLADTTRGRDLAVQEVSDRLGALEPAAELVEAIVAFGKVQFERGGLDSDRAWTVGIGEHPDISWTTANELFDSRNRKKEIQK